MPERQRIWRHRHGAFQLGSRVLLMGVVNVTPDSFSDGGSFLEPQAAVAHALRLQAEGADMLDLGAESTRPGSTPIAAAEQMRRLEPVITGIVQQSTIPLSIDTSDVAVARMALDAGASIVNDVTAFRDSRDLPKLCAEYKAGVVLMHMRGTPATMQADTAYADLIGDVRAALQASIGVAHVCNIAHEYIMVDPGLGFGKSFAQNHQLLGSLSQFSDLAAGVLVGPSRKGFTAEFSRKLPGDRQFGTAAAVALAALNGADVLRVHDVAQMKEVVEIIGRYRSVHAH